ncbi:50S ribosomal protein L15 [Candidatus Saccharibacteria bacterium]|nr:50S ribosomal protein L15 [Candidatus Saccharibacteria bacterium]MCB9821540.1 50S ribosomal protein L15 [Candidatus Nomurabacteria bacterium]
MKFNELNIEARKQPTRVGRGISAGKGKTAGRGTKGQKARTGGNIRPGFEGGQNPLIQRLPKLRGFKSHRPLAYTIYTGQLDAIKSQKINSTVLADAGLIKDAYHTVKLVVKGELKTAKTLEISAISASALAMVQSAGGSFVRTAKLQRPKKNSSKNDK